MNAEKRTVRHLQPGNVLNGSGETVIWVGRGVRTPQGKMEVVLKKGPIRRLAIWGASTTVSIKVPA